MSHSEKKKVFILGAGAMGCLYGALLSADPALEVTFVTHHGEQASLLEKQGILVTEGNSSFHVPVRCMVSGTECGKADYVLVFVKAHQTEQAFSANPALFGKGTRVLTLQNGLGGALFLKDQIPGALFACGISNHNSTQTAPGQILHGGTGRTLIGAFSPEGETCAQEFAGLLGSVMKDVEYTCDVRTAIWEKLMVNLAINPLTALYQVRNGQIALQQTLWKEAVFLIREALLVAQKEGVFLEEEKVLDHVFKVAHATGEGRSSMLQDRLAARKTEIDAINGSILLLGKKYGLELPHNQKIVQALHILEKEYGASR